ncbi:MAG: hypothetical protein ACRD6X_20435 [Pyrinomonadaceae bacterium]
MTKKLLVLIAVLAFGLSVAGQTKSGLSAREEQLAKTLAAQFFNEYQRTRSIESLVRKFVIKDFAPRAAFCWKSLDDDCGGFARDFWNSFEESSPSGFTTHDFFRFYVSVSDFLFIRHQCLRYLALASGRSTDEFTDDDVCRFKKLLEEELRDRPDLHKFEFLGESGIELWWYQGKNVSEFRKILGDAEKYNAAGRKVEVRLQKDLMKSRPTLDLRIFPNQLRVDLKINEGRFFKYPKGTRIIQVWPNGVDVPFVLDMIKHNGRIKIVAAYAPMD